MNSKVVAIIHSFTNQTGFPVCWGKLECGHACNIQLRAEHVCSECTTVQPVVNYNYRCQSVGCAGWLQRVGDVPNAHNPADQVTKVGDMLNCERCAHKAAALVELKTLIAGGNLSHSRYRNGSIYVYAYDHTSPSGFLLAAGVEDCPEAHELLRGGMSPLSPTEKR